MFLSNLKTEKLLLQFGKSSQRVLAFSELAFMQTANKMWKAEDCIPPALYHDIDVPGQNRLLKPMLKMPVKPPVDRRRKANLVRGPCVGEQAQLLHGQFGIIALKGGWFKIGHFNVMMNKVNRYIRNKPLHAVWRIEAPYHPVTKHPIQAVMGGGKGKIDHYVTPVKARRVILEVAGKAQYPEIFPVLRNIATLLPVPALAVNKEMLEAMYEEERRIEDDNENFFTFREIIAKNMQGINTKVTMYDYKQFGKMR